MTSTDHIFCAQRGVKSSKKTSWQLLFIICSLFAGCVHWIVHRSSGVCSGVCTDCRQWCAIWIEQCADKDLVTHRSEPCQVFWSHLSRLQTVHRNLQRLFVALITHWQKCWPQVEIYFVVVDNDLQTKNAFPPRFYGLCLAEYGEETVCRRDRIPGENYWKNYLAFKTWKQLN